MLERSTRRMHTQRSACVFVALGARGAKRVSRCVGDFAPTATSKQIEAQYQALAKAALLTGGRASSVWQQERGGRAAGYV